MDTLVDLVYGFLWYRLLMGHAPLDANAARDLTAHLIAAGASGASSRGADGQSQAPGQTP
jgi:hypothetical protein